MLGVLFNAAAIAIGGLIGMIANKHIPKKLADLLLIANGLCAIYIGISGSLSGENALITVLSMSIGGIIGYVLKLDDRVNNGARKIEEKFAKGEATGGFAKGFSAASILFCVGAMAIIGSIQASFGDNSVLMTKGVMDGVTAAVMASSLGYGVIFSAIPIIIYQGAIVLLAPYIAPEYCLNEMTCAGSILVAVIGLNMIGVTKIKVMDLMPAMFIPILLCLFM